MHYRIEALIYVCTGTEKLHGVTFKPDISLRFVFFVCIVYASWIYIKPRNTCPVFVVTVLFILIYSCDCMSLGFSVWLQVKRRGKTGIHVLDVLKEWLHRIRRKKETNRTNCCCIWSLAAGKLQRCTKRIWLKWFHLPARPNECVSPQGSVEAQCGLVLNGQGGVIRRGKAPVYSLLRLLLLLLLLLLYRRPWTLTGSTRQDSEQTDKQAEHSSLVCCQHATAGTAPICRLFKQQRCTGAEAVLPTSSMSLNTHVFLKHQSYQTLALSVADMIKMQRINVVTYISSVLIQLPIGLVLKCAFDTCPVTLKLRQKLLFWSQTCG